jgi:hypothetical protein
VPADNLGMFPSGDEGVYRNLSIRNPEGATKENEMNNICLAGYYCSVYTTQEEILECHGRRPDDWNGLCPFQNGRALALKEINKNGNIEVKCDKCKCEFSPTEYICWNGLCGKR